MTTSANRRSVVLGLAACLGLPNAGQAEEPLILNWSDLVPSDGGIDMDALRALGVVQHGQLTTPFDQELGAEVTDAYNGRLVQIPGFLVPLRFDNLAVTEGLLVPYVGACIHVPPPPPNQLIFVTAQTPYESQEIFEPVWVSGTFGTNAAQTMLAEVGYEIVAQRIDPYTF